MTGKIFCFRFLLGRFRWHPSCWVKWKLMSFKKVLHQQGSVAKLLWRLLFGSSTIFSEAFIIKFWGLKMCWTFLSKMDDIWTWVATLPSLSVIFILTQKIQFFRKKFFQINKILIKYSKSWATDFMTTIKTFYLSEKALTHYQTFHSRTWAQKIIFQFSGGLIRKSDLFSCSKLSQNFIIESLSSTAKKFTVWSVLE